MLRRFLSNYIARHQNPVNQILHLIGLPLTFIVPVYVLVDGGSWLLAWTCFLTGYALQFSGHAWEGNDPGEVILVRKMRGIPFVEVAPFKPEVPAVISNKFEHCADDRPKDQ